MFIGELSNRTGASIKAIRLYEELGLLTGVARSGRYRTYNRDHVALVRLILEAKSLGFQLSELKQLAAREEGVSPWHRIIAMIERKESLVQAQLEALQTRKRTLSDYREQIRTCLATNSNCPLDEAALDSPPGGRP